MPKRVMFAGAAPGTQHSPVVSAVRFLEAVTGGRSRAWVEDAACATVDPDLWYPDGGDNTSPAKAKKVCRTCPVIDQCAQAGTGEWFGIWGGLSEYDRRQERARAHARARRRGVA